MSREDNVNILKLLRLQIMVDVQPEFYFMKRMHIEYVRKKIENFVTGEDVMNKHILCKKII